MTKREQCFNEVVTLIKEAVNEDWIHEFDFEESTTFNDDLELESIEFVQIAEKIQAYYGSDVTLTDWLTSMPFEKVITLSVGDLIDFVILEASAVANET